MPRRAGAVLIALLLLGSACSGGAPSVSPAPASGSPWTQVRALGSGGFPPEPGSNDRPLWEPGKIPVTLPPILAFGGSLWMTSQTNAWSSSDGLDWRHSKKTDTGERIWQSTVFFKDRLWSLGGLRYSDRTPVNTIWSSSDGTTWQQSGTAGWSPRKELAAVVFRDRLWVFGGADKVKPSDFSTEHALNDVWSSDDVVHWTRVTAAAPWSPREGAKVVVHDDALYMLGAEGLHDVWRSTDGVTWTQPAEAAPWAARFGYGAADFGGRMWVFGGWIGRSTNARNDVWYSTDGTTWTRQTRRAPWGPRSPLSIVFKDKLWIYSGKHTGARDSWGGDVWTMSDR